MKTFSKAFIFIIISIPFHILAYQWPLSPFSGSHPINAVLGEFRVPYGSLNEHFHSGVDIKSTNEKSGEKSGTVLQKFKSLASIAISAI